MKRLFLHICCGPCTIGPLGVLRSEGFEVQGYFYNPNIHPYSEYQRRRESLELLAAAEELPVAVEEGYPLREYLTGAVAAEARDERCRHCYQMRLGLTARRAKEAGWPLFSTTLLGSPYQDRELLLAAGREAGAREGVTFLEADFRPVFRDGWRRAREMGLYTQKYCGCVFSEYEGQARRRRP